MHGRIFGAVAREALDVFHRHVELVVAVIDDLQTVMGCAANIQRLEPLIASDAMVDMDDEVAFGKGCQLGQETVGLGPALRRSGHAVTQDIGLGDDGEITGDKTMIERQQHEANHVARQRLGRRPVGRLIATGKAVIGHDMLQPVAASLADGGYQNTSASSLFFDNAFADGVVEVHLRPRPGLGEVAPTSPARIGLALGGGKG